MVDSNLLNTLARYQSVDPAEQYRAGQAQGRKAADEKAITAGRVQQQGISGRQEDDTIKLNAMKDSVSYAQSAMLSKDPETREKNIELMVIQANKTGNPQAIALANGLKNATPEERQPYLEKVVSMAESNGWITRDPTNVSRGASSSKILSNGYTVQAKKEGGVAFYSPDNQLVTDPNKIQELIGEAHEMDIDVASRTAGGKKGAEQKIIGETQPIIDADIINAKGGAKIAIKAYESLAGIRQNIRQLDEAERLIVEEGANTGPIIDRLPTLIGASQKLANLQGQMGLNVIQNTTFGSLSQAELEFALSTALPTEMNEKDLVEWIRDKAAAQRKLAQYVEAAAVWMGEKGTGRTVSDWLKYQRAQSPDQGGTKQTITTQAEYDKLPLGAVFIEDGKEYRKE